MDFFWLKRLFPKGFCGWWVDGICYGIYKEQSYICILSRSLVKTRNKKLWIFYKRSVQLCQSVLYILAALNGHECDEMQTVHRLMIIQLSWNQFLEWTSKSVQDSYTPKTHKGLFNPLWVLYTLYDFKRNFRKHFLCKN